MKPCRVQPSDEGRVFFESERDNNDINLQSIGFFPLFLGKMGKPGDESSQSWWKELCHVSQPGSAVAALAWLVKDSAVLGLGPVVHGSYMTLG